MMDSNIVKRLLSQGKGVFAASKSENPKLSARRSAYVWNYLKLIKL
jgi:hypothetical protein